MRVLLQRNLFAEGTRYRVHSAGTELPDHIELPPGAKVWDGKEFVKAPEGKREREALAKKSSKAVEAEAEEELPATPTRIYDPRFKSPNSPEPIQGTTPLTGEERKAEEEREKIERRREMARIKAEEAGEPSVSAPVPPGASETKTKK